jgi:hypothetical protein
MGTEMSMSNGVMMISRRKPKKSERQDYKKILKYQPKGLRIQGRPQKRWLDCFVIYV